MKSGLSASVKTRVTTMWVFLSVNTGNEAHLMKSVYSGDADQLSLQKRLLLNNFSPGYMILSLKEA